MFRDLDLSHYIQNARKVGRERTTLHWRGWQSQWGLSEVNSIGLDDEHIISCQTQSSGKCRTSKSIDISHHLRNVRCTEQEQVILQLDRVVKVSYRRGQLQDCRS